MFEVHIKTGEGETITRQVEESEYRTWLAGECRHMSDTKREEYINEQVRAHKMRSGSMSQIDLAKIDRENRRVEKELANPNSLHNILNRY